MWTRSWIGFVLLVACNGVKPTEEDRYHPIGWSDPVEHGPAAKLQDLECVACHGADLDGGSAGVSCDACHVGGWRTDCTFCHGGTDNLTGAPPGDIDGLDTSLSFPEHTLHLDAVDHPAWTCDQCHETPVDVLSSGHLFVGDDTPGTAEVAFVGGLSGVGVYAVGVSCSNLYCHGNGAADLGAVSTGERLDCGGCHGDAAKPDTMSGVHREHLGGGATCADCHAATATGSDTIADPTLHVDGTVEIGLAAGMTWDGTCTGACHDVPHDEARWEKGGFHPVGWDEPDQHGLAAKLQTQDCTTCHGADLSGGLSRTDCDSCHIDGWRTDCTYCHGGVDNTTGAPPSDIDGADTALSFDEHTLHVEAVDHAAWDCAQCHGTPIDVLTPGHLFVGDTTPGVAELTFVDGLSPAGTYFGGGSCSNLYCHGDGAATLGVATSGETLDCAGCHGSAAAPAALSGVHAGHLTEGAACADCHADTATGSDTISGRDNHVDGEVDVALAAGMTYAAGTCSGTCHGVPHLGSSWSTGLFHAVGWADAEEHGLAANRQDQVCTACHGADLTGGTSGEGCDSCHVAGWRTDCTYCHGGTDDSTGAPPEYIDGTGTSASFDEHTVHVEEMDHPAWGCEQCHVNPTDVLTSGHVFVGDSTPAVAELVFTSGLSSAGAYAGGGSCSNLYCHGNGAGTLGSVTTGSTTTCGSCHGSSTSYSGLSGRHSDHLDRDVAATCDECHAATVSSSTAISDPLQHVDGGVDLSFPSGMVRSSAGRCTGFCHEQDHHGERW